MGGNSSKTSRGYVLAMAAVTLAAAAMLLALAPGSVSSPGWSAPVNISGTITGNSGPQIAVDAGGNPHAVWSGHDGATDRIYYSANTGAGWSTPLNISPGATTSNAMPRIALDSGGNPHVVWHGNDGSTYRVYYSANTGSGWSAPLNISPGATTNDLTPQIALDAGGNPHVVWFGNDGSSDRIYYSASTGAGWFVPLNISTSSTSNWTPQLALDPAGNPHVVWRGDDGSDFRVYYSAGTSSGWSTPLNISPGAISFISDPQIALDSDGNPHVTWEGDDASTKRIWYSANTGSGWTDPLNISPGTTGNFSSRIALDPAGDPHVVWYGNDGSIDRIYYSDKSGAGWSTPANLSPGTTGNYSPQIAMDPSGGPHVLWSGNDGSTNRVYYSAGTGAGWSAPANLSPGPISFISDQQIALDANGDPHAVWQGDDGPTSRIWYSADVMCYFYFAEGYTGEGSFDEYLCLMNPGTSETTAHITYMFPDGTTQEEAVPVGATSRTTVKVNNQVGPDREVSVKVASAAPIVAERPMYFDYDGKWTGGHDVIGAGFPRTTFYFAEGYTGAGRFDEYLCLMNPSPTDAVARVTYMFPDGSIQEEDVEVGATSRTTVKVNEVVGPNREVSVMIASDRPIVAERPMYFDYDGKWTGGHDVIGAAAPRLTFYFAEGYTGAGVFDEYLCLMNPGSTEANAQVTYMFPDGTTQVQDVEVGATTRTTVKVNEVVGPDREVSVMIASDRPIVAERPMYFDYDGKWTGGHDVIGAAAPRLTFYFAEGYTGAGVFDEYLCLANPDTKEAGVTITYIFKDGSTKEQELKVGATTRVTVKVNDQVGPDRDVSVIIEANEPIVAERPMYFNYTGGGGNWTGGHDVVGYTP